MAEPKGCLWQLLVALGIIPKNDNQASAQQVTEEFPFTKRTYFFTVGERKFFEVLAGICEGNCVLFSKVRLADLVSVNKGTEKWGSHFNRIKSKHIDFVICRNESVQPLLCIELDDKSHDKPARQERDRFVDHVLQAAGLPILRVRAARHYDSNELLRQIKNAMLHG